MGRVSQLIRPDPLVFDSFNTSIHGISATDVVGAPSFAEFWPNLHAHLSGPLVAHNAAFDMSALRYALDYAGTPYPEVDYFCTRIIAKRIWPQHSTYALNHIAQTVGITFQHHDAAEDAKACALVALAACKQVNVNSLYDLQDRCGIRVGRIFNSGYSPCGYANTAAQVTQHGNKLRAVEIVSASNVEKINSPCCGMSFVFTETLSSMPRRCAMQSVVDRGGFCHDTVKNETDYLVLGQEGFNGYQSGHKSSKMRKAEEMRSNGSPIEIISEADFLGML